MRIYRLIALLAAMLPLLTACHSSSPPRRDILLEATQNFDEVVDDRLVRGREVYDRYCSVCHGLEGKGDGFNSYNLNPRPRDFSDSTFLLRMDTTLIIETVSKGGAAVGLSPLMPPWGNTISATDIRYVARYVEHLARFHDKDN